MRAPQLDLDLAPKTWGGARPGAGRKKSGTRRDPLHRIRPEHVRRHPVHVVLRVRKAVGRLRRREVFKAARRALDAMLAKHATFRVVHLSMQHNHLHLLVEAQDKHALSRGMQAFATSLARRVNAAVGRRGKVFEYRYHATAITSPRQARHALAYVLRGSSRIRREQEAHARWSFRCAVGETALLRSAMSPRVMRPFAWAFASHAPANDPTTRDSTLRRAS